MTYSRPWMYFGLSLMAIGGVLLWHQNTESIATAEPAATEKPAAKTEKPAAADAQQQPGKDQEKNKAKTPWKELFDGKTLDGWKVPQLGGEGKVNVKDGAIVLEMGSSMTAVTWAGDVLRNNYELALEGMRLDGCDFFCTTTFPVGDDPCSLVVGGWGGSLVGLSNIDHFDASENPTTTMVEFKEKQWYRIRIRVSDSAIQAWINDKLVVNQARKGHKIGIRMEVEDCRPLGIATWYTKGAVRNIRVRPLTPDEVRIAEVELGDKNNDQ
jgi:hypothetical protein